MMNARESAEEKISALIDGDINYRAIDSTLAALEDRNGQNSWDLYHHIGDILRSEKNAGNSSDAFMQRFKLRFEDELPHGQPVRVVINLPEARPVGPAPITRPSFFSTLFNRRFALPGVAALGAAIVAFVSAPLLTTADIGTRTASPEATASSAGILTAGNDGKTVAVKLAHPPPATIAMPEPEMGLQAPGLNSPMAGHQPISPPVYKNVLGAGLVDSAGDLRK